MSLCCTSTMNLGCFGSCEDINTGIVAAMDGDYTVNAYFLAAVITQTVPLLTGEELIIPNIYNENATIIFNIQDPNGDDVTLLGNDCLSITTFIQKTV